MAYVIITTNMSWLANWRALLGLVKATKPQIHCRNLREFAHLQLEPGTLIFFDTASMGMPKYLPYNPSSNLSECNFVLVNTVELENAALTHFLKAGYCGIIRSNERPEQVLKALENLTKNEIWFPRSIVEQAVKDYQRNNSSPDQVVYELAAAYGLSKREQQVCLALIDGHKNCEIANKLFISTHTVKCHVTSLYRKLGVNSRHEILQAVNRQHRLGRGITEPSIQ
ncbi:MAG: response regulator transcription factor [Idiomarina sp.]|nr:response regulator transcription factor [Idiomarina sp.]